MDLAHYEALMIVNNPDFVGVNYAAQLLHTGEMLYNASTELITILEYFSKKWKVQDLPLAV